MNFLEIVGALALVVSALLFSALLLLKLLADAMSDMPRRGDK